MKEKLKNNWKVLLVAALSLAIAWPVFVPGYFSHHDDLQVIRVFEMRRCFIDFQIPCRWTPDMGYGYGFPLFNYYAPLAYYVGGVASFALSYIASSKFIFFIVTLLAGVSMYLLASELFGSWAGLASGILYAYAPYRAVDIYVRGAVSESLAVAVIPLVFYATYKYRKNKSGKSLVFIAVSFGLFMLSHNIMALIFMPFIVPWEVIGFSQVDFKTNLKVVFMYLLGFGLSAFFVLPAFFERSLINTLGLISYELDFRANYLAVGQLIKRSWGYVLQDPKLANSMSFQLGWPHIILVALSLIAFVYLFLKEGKKKTKELRVVVFFGISLALSLFMTHNKSTFIWEAVDILKYVQFPWRFISVSILFASLLGGFFVTIFKKPFINYISLFIAMVTVILNFEYFRPEKLYNLTDAQKLSGESFEVQKKGALLDYLPVGAKEPKSKAPDFPEFGLGEGKVTDYQTRSNYWSFSVDVTSDLGTIEVPIFDFPNWQISIDGRSITHSKTPWGTILLEVQKGRHFIYARFKDTLLRRVSNLISLISVLSVGLYVFKYARKNQKKRK